MKKCLPFIFFCDILNLEYIVCVKFFVNQIFVGRAIVARVVIYGTVESSVPSESI